MACFGTHSNLGIILHLKRSRLYVLTLRTHLAGSSLQVSGPLQTLLCTPYAGAAGSALWFSSLRLSYFC